MFKVISDIMAHRYDIWNTIVFSINTCKQIELCNHVYHHWIKWLTNLLPVEPCSGMYKVISDIMAHCYHMWIIIVIAMQCWWLCIEQLSM